MDDAELKRMDRFVQRVFRKYGVEEEDRLEFMAYSFGWYECKVNDSLTDKQAYELWHEAFRHAREWLDFMGGNGVEEAAS